MKSYRSAILAGLTLSITIIERLFRNHFCVKLIPIVEPGDFSISINNGPVACLTLSKDMHTFDFNQILMKIFILPTIATSYSIRNNVVPRHCRMRLCASCNVAPPTLIPLIAKTRSPILIVLSLDNKKKRKFLLFVKYYILTYQLVLANVSLL